ncbi:MAG TPA: hypothetical protein VM735_05440, partial [Candidatus Kapabacteria bacterium]|nr:hypothetical protein [Candidatus Kapabacteria bacterium]
CFPVFFLDFLAIFRVSVPQCTALVHRDERGPIASFLYSREYLPFDAILFFAFSYTIWGKLNFFRLEKS